MTRTPIPRKRSPKLGYGRKPRRKRPELFYEPQVTHRFIDPRSYVTKGGRVRLFGKDMENLRAQACLRSIQRYGTARCECGCGREALWEAPGELYYKRGDLAHKQHGPWKSDVLSEVLWKNWYCHRVTEHNPKPCAKKVMIPTMGFYAPKGLA